MLIETILHIYVYAATLDRPSPADARHLHRAKPLEYAAASREAMLWLSTPPLGGRTNN